MKMGTSFKKAIFDEHVQERLVGWAESVKKKKGLRAASEEVSTLASSHTEIQLE